MKNYNKFLGITAMALVIGFLMTGCATEPPADSKDLSVPAKVTINVTGRTMVVEWKQVANASGYEIITYSEGCGSGRKKIDTKAGTAVVYNKEDPENSSLANALGTKKDDGTPANGSVEILGKTKIQITLMPAMGDDTKPMATAVTAKVMALGGKKYTNSEYSPEVKKELGGGMGM